MSWTTTLMLMIMLMMVMMTNGEETATPDNIRMTTNKLNRDCSTDLSQKVRAILDNAFYPIVLDHSYQLPDNCQFNPRSDMLAYLETQKINLYGTWKCRNCTKQFKSEDFLDQHLKNVHANLVPENVTVCLGDFCEIFNCREDVANIACDTQKMEKLKYFCQGIMYNCFPLNQEKSKSLNVIFNAQICDQLTCDEDRKKKSVQKLKDLNQFTNKVYSWSLLKYIAALVTIIILILFYLIVCFYKKETTLQKDLRRLPSKRHQDLLKHFESKKKNF
ncbi:hypothetical protein SAMD00019534_106010 [Acytostelium subglobosum LB1]|uniref:hypothetical protein n=1 Tax=Acytostelium subglobosum LB1 TaxID=1410327 RepID=UPI0006447CB8|nr:hypothetical protein SAMD00019534_106010 [Acytostelium subglobosum LB1]GAM27425.1 hypothetical protein SAMD00019534_106010 [Acytostelium subglobosum LB1]|eukprot:XP_012749490.1 hypothetical protein SAMD00019534_106010 [Acytostelium subglobosum LB1]